MAGSDDKDRVYTRKERKRGSGGECNNRGAREKMMKGIEFRCERGG